MNLPKYYANVCEEMPPDYSDYENYEVKFGYVSHIKVTFIDHRKTMKSLKRLAEESTQKSTKALILPTMSASLLRSSSQVGPLLIILCSQKDQD